MIFTQGMPIVIRENFYKVLTEAHKGCSHGGQDRTYGQVQLKYSWWENPRYNVSIHSH